MTGSLRRVALCFPGQGSQRVGLGRTLASEFAAARRVFEETDEALSQNLSRLMFEGPEEELTLTVMTSKRCAWTDGAAFCALVERSCHELHAVLLKEGQTAQVRSREAVLEHASVGSSAPGPAAKL